MKFSILKIGMSLLSLLTVSFVLSGCSSNSASQAANESAATITSAALDESENLSVINESENDDFAPVMGMPIPSFRPNEVRQPDGTVILLYLKGTACLNWEEDENGYTVTQQGKRYVYAKKSKQDQLLPTEFEVGKHSPSELGLTKHLHPEGTVSCLVE